MPKALLQVVGKSRRREVNYERWAMDLAPNCCAEARERMATCKHGAFQKMPT